MTHFDRYAFEADERTRRLLHQARHAALVESVQSPSASLRARVAAELRHVADQLEGYPHARGASTSSERR